MTGKSSFRVGKVRGELRGRIWYLHYYEQGVRFRPRVGPEKKSAQQLAAQINGQLASGAPAALSFQPQKISELRQAWLEHHEQTLRSSLQTVRRYRAATQHLVNFLAQGRAPQSSGQFRAEHAEQFVRYLRQLHVSPNGHPHSARRPLMDKGILYILEVCRALFNFAMKRRHLSPYAENPFSSLRLDRLPLEHKRPILLFTPQQEKTFLEGCSDWQFPLFLTLILTGLRPGELVHLLLPEDLDLKERALVIRNRPALGWQVKTRTERTIPLHPVLCKVLKISLAGRQVGPLFQQLRYTPHLQPALALLTESQLEGVIAERVREIAAAPEDQRATHLRVCRQVWREMGAIETNRVRREFVAICRRQKSSEFTSPKMFRHLFATTLQEANVDPLIRLQLMGHSLQKNLQDGGLGMTGNYTHTRMETKRRQLEQGLERRSALAVARQWLREKEQGRVSRL